MTWTVETLREYRQYPQSDEVIQQSLDLATADVDRVNADASQERKDRVIETLVRIDLGPRAEEQSANQLEAERARVLQTLVPSVFAVADGRQEHIYPPRYWI